MAEYGVTDKGFNIKRLDTIMEEIHTDLSADFGFDTRLTKPSFLDTLITTFSNQISELWETAQNNYWQVSMLRTLLFLTKDTGSSCGIRTW